MKTLLIILLVVSKTLLCALSSFGIFGLLMMLGLSGKGRETWLTAFYLCGILYCLYCLVCGSGFVKGKALFASAIFFHIVLAVGIILFYRNSEEMLEDVLIRAGLLTVTWIVHAGAQTSYLSIKNTKRLI